MLKQDKYYDVSVEVKVLEIRNKREEETRAHNNKIIAFKAKRG